MNPSQLPQVLVGERPLLQSPHLLQMLRLKLVLHRELELLLRRQRRHPPRLPHMRVHLLLLELLELKLELLLHRNLVHELGVGLLIRERSERCLPRKLRIPRLERESVLILERVRRK